MVEMKALYAITVQLVRELERLDEPELDREGLIRQINELIEQRETLMPVKTREPYSEEELTIGKQIIRMNEEIKGKMNRLYDVIKTDMKQVQKKKKQNYSYIKPYGNLKTTDGIYLDNKL